MDRFRTCEIPTHRTLRDGSLGWRFPRHFVPGYDRTVPPGLEHRAAAKHIDFDLVHAKKGRSL